MKILLYIPQTAFTTDSNRELVTSLNTCLRKTCHSDIVHNYSPKMLDGISLLHVFGCWNREAAKVMKKATKAGIPTVFSPLGGLEPWSIKGKHTKRRLQAASYQRSMTRQASAVHVGGRFEQEMFSKLKWNSRIAIIKNPALTSLVSPEKMTEEMLHLYQKVFDSNVCTLLSPTASEALSHLLHAAINDRLPNMPDAMAEAHAALDATDDTDWRNICIYADDEHITDYLEKGIRVMQYNKELVVVEESQRFIGKSSYADGDIKHDDVLSSNIMLKSNVEDLASDEQKTEFELCMMILNIRHELSHQSLPLRHVLNLAERLMADNYDEDSLIVMLTATGAQKFMARLEAAMQSIVRLNEGYMPVRPIYDRLTDEMTARITKLKTTIK